jgi:hypothetical protein
MTTIQHPSTHTTTVPFPHDNSLNYINPYLQQWRGVHDTPHEVIAAHENNNANIERRIPTHQTPVDPMHDHTFVDKIHFDTSIQHKRWNTTTGNSRKAKNHGNHPKKLHNPSMLLLSIWPNNATKTSHYILTIHFNPATPTTSTLSMKFDPCINTTLRTTHHPPN